MVSENLLVSVIIVNHNGRDFVDDCLTSVLNSNYPHFDVIFVDNASTDGSLRHVKEKFGGDSRLRFVENSASLGPAVGRNRGAKIAKSKYLIFLDNDTKVDPDWINELTKVLENDNSIGAAQAKLLRMGTDEYDCAGDYLGPLGFLIERARGAKDEGQFDYITDILSAKSVASIIRKDIFDKIGNFDESYYMYLEETDLSWRVWLSGHRVVFVPNSIVYHAFNTPRKDFKRYYPKYVVRYYGCRNYISTLVKNLEFINLLKILPLHMVCWFLISILFLFRFNLADTFYIWRAMGWNIFHFGSLLKKRYYINADIREVHDHDILSRVMDKRNIGYYLGKAFSYVSGKAF